MKRSLLQGVLWCCLAGAAVTAMADDARIMRLASLEWLPYVGASLEQEGWSGSVAIRAAALAGYAARIEYFPWTRALQLGQKDPAYAGYFPTYYTEERARNCHFSAPIGASTVVLAYRKDTPLRWNTLQDLKQVPIAVVAGFANGAEFDAMVSAGELKVDTSPNDMLNLRKLLARRVDVAVVDKLVLRYLLTSSLAAERERIAVHEKPLSELPMHICFQRTPQGKEMQQAFDAALHTMPLRKLEAEYFQRLEHR